jgi:hypothetical protein
MLGLAAEAVPAEIAVSTGHKLTLDDDGLITSAEPCSASNACLANFRCAATARARPRSPRDSNR